MSGNSSSGSTTNGPAKRTSNAVTPTRISPIRTGSAQASKSLWSEDLKSSGSHQAGGGEPDQWFVEDFQLRSPLDEFGQLAEELIENLGEADRARAHACRRAVELVASRLGGEEGGLA